MPTLPLHTRFFQSRLNVSGHRGFLHKLRAASPKRTNSSSGMLRRRSREFSSLDFYCD
jgi:hypothetical protein